MDLKLIPAGTFTIGNNSHESRSGTTNRSKRFYIGVYRVTQEQYEQVVGSDPSKIKGAQNPVDNVSWEDAAAFSEVIEHCERNKRQGAFIVYKRKRSGMHVVQEQRQRSVLGTMSTTLVSTCGLSRTAGIHHAVETSERLGLSAICTGMFGSGVRIQLGLSKRCGDDSRGTINRHGPRTPWRQLDPRRGLLPSRLPDTRAIQRVAAATARLATRATTDSAWS